MITISQTGDFKKTTNFLKNLRIKWILHKLDKYGQEGVAALSGATPVDTGLTAASWNYEVRQTENTVSITWTNTNATPEGIPIVVLIQYGHATRNGGYVKGRDFINPAIRPVFDSIANDVWKEVEKL